MYLTVTEDKNDNFPAYNEASSPTGNLLDAIYARAAPQIEIDPAQFCRSFTILSIVFDATYRAALKGASVVSAAVVSHPSSGQRVVPHKGGVVSGLNQDSMICGWFLAMSDTHNEWCNKLLVGFRRRGSRDARAVASLVLLSFIILVVGVDNCCSMRPAIQHVLPDVEIFGTSGLGLPQQF